MNTNPDEATLALWLDDELTGEELAAVDSWAAGRPDQLSAREEIRRWQATISSALPASEEPPFPDFFNSRVMQGIRESSPKMVPAVPAKGFSWTSWLMPIAACAGMVLTFWAGKNSQPYPDYDVAGAPKAIPVEPIVYTPERGVQAEWFSGALASVIVLNGVAAIPDSIDFSEASHVPEAGEFEFTAGGAAEPGRER